MTSSRIVTNVTRILTRDKIPFDTDSYEYDEEDLSAVHAAQTLGTDPANVYKTLVCVMTHGYAVFVIPSAKELDLKKCAAAAGEKRAELLPLKELLPLTGYMRGGCSPVGMKKHFPTFIDSSAQGRDRIYVSAGKRGCQIILAPGDLLRETQAAYADVTRDE